VVSSGSERWGSVVEAGREGILFMMLRGRT
jgi:hypothetical protein